MNKNSGFVAGTWVYTDQGLVPIQDIKVGDRVLSKAENDPNGELSYQRITETHQYENKSLYMLHVAEGFPERNEPEISDFFTMSNHPFWKVGVGWVHADLLKIGDEILLGNGKKAQVFGWSPVLRTKNLKTGWIASILKLWGK